MPSLRPITALLAVPLIAAVLAAAPGCAQVSTEELAKEVKKGIKEKFAQDPETAKIVVGDLMLVSRGGNDYRGILEVTADGEKAELTVDVSYDGENLMWQINE